MLIMDENRHQLRLTPFGVKRLPWVLFLLPRSILYSKPLLVRRFRGRRHRTQISANSRSPAIHFHAHALARELLAGRKLAFPPLHQFVGSQGEHTAAALVRDPCNRLPCSSPTLRSLFPLGKLK